MEKNLIKKCSLFFILFFDFFVSVSKRCGYFQFQVSRTVPKFSNADYMKHSSIIALSQYCRGPGVYCMYV